MKYFIFDLYGTLADVKTDETSPRFRVKYAKYFKRINSGIDFWQSFNGESGALNNEEYSEPDLFSVFKKLAPSASEKKLKNAAYTFRRFSRSRLKLYKGAKKLLKGLKRRGAKIYLLSNAQACFTLPELKKLKICKYFDGIELSSDFGRKKPCTEFFTYALKKYGLDAKDCVYCGNDFCADVLGAKSAGLKTAYIKSDISPAEDSLEEAEKVSDFAASDYEEFINYLFNACG